MHRRGGSRSQTGIVSSGWGLSTLWLLWDISRGYGCSRRHRRRCFGTLNWRDVCGSPKSARGIFGRRTGQNPGPVSMPSSRPNHSGRLGCAAEARWACSRGEMQGCAGLKENGGGGGGGPFYGACEEVRGS